MAFSYVASSKVTNGGNSAAPATGTITAPSSGDLVIIAINSNNNSTEVTHGGGEGTAFTRAAHYVEAAKTCTQAIFWKIAGSEPTSYTFAAGNAQWRVCMAVFSTPENDATVDLAPVTNYNTSHVGQELNCQAGNGRTVSDDSLSIIFGAKDNRGTNQAYTVIGSSYDDVVGNCEDQACALGWRIWTTGGAESADIEIKPTDFQDEMSDNTMSIHMAFLEGAASGTTTVNLEASGRGILRGVNRGIG